MSTYDAGRPMPANVRTDARVRFHRFSNSTRQVSVRNEGPNTLWLSLDRKTWHDVASGTSWDDRTIVDGLWHRTQVGRTHFVVSGLQIQCSDAMPKPTDDELETL